MAARCGKKRKGLQLPEQDIMWGFQYKDGTYTKIVVTVRSCESPHASAALASFGKDMTFIGEICPPVQSVLAASGGGMSGHRNFSKIPLADLSSFKSMLDLGSVHFLEQREGREGQKTWTISQLESVFGTCPARSGTSNSKLELF